MILNRVSKEKGAAASTADVTRKPARTLPKNWATFKTAPAKQSSQSPAVSAQVAPAIIAPPPNHTWLALAIADLARSGITPAQADAVGMFSLDRACEIDPEFRAEPALVIPYFNMDGSPKMFQRDNERLHFCRVRYLDPPIDPFTRKRKSKYDQPRGSGVHIYFPRTSSWADVAGNPDETVFGIEGEKKTVRVGLEGYNALGIGGCWMWRQDGGLQGIKLLDPDLARFAVPGREIVLALDGDTATNKSVAAAEGHLALELGQRRGADVYRIRFPFEGTERMGADDFLERRGSEAFYQLAKAAEKMGEADAAVAELNQKYAVVSLNGKVLVMREERDEALNRRVLSFSTKNDFELLLGNRTVAKPANPSERTKLARVWIEHPHRREYPDGMILAPMRDVTEGKFNLWRGFSIEPAAGDWSLLRNHIRDNICSGDAGCFEYVLNWLAWMVQHPDMPGQVAIVLRGKKGTGKSKLGYWIGQMMREHFFHATQSAHVTGQFNSHLLATVFMLADEALFAGDPKNEKILNGLITEETRTSEQKFMPAITVPNYLHIMMATNSTWAVPATEDERRYLVLDVSDAHMQDHRYFAAIDGQMGTSGLAAMLHDLLARDVSQFEVRKFPRTAALAEQQVQTLHGRGTVAGWVYDCLSAGEIRDDRERDICFAWSKGELEIPKNTARRIFDNWAKQHGRRPIDPRVFGKEFRDALGPSLRETRRRTGTARSENYVLSSLEDCRQAYRLSMKAPGLWSGDDE